MSADRIASLPCCAPGAPASCTGPVGAYSDGAWQAVPLCQGHTADVLAVRGPWKTINGATAWLNGIRPVIAARLADVGRRMIGDRPEDPSGTPGKTREPWVNWSAVRAGEEAAPKFVRHYSDEARAAYAAKRAARSRHHVKPVSASATAGEAKTLENPEKNAKKRGAGKVPWYVRRRWKKKGAG